MLLTDLFEKTDMSLMGRVKKPLKPEKNKLCFPKKEVWHHVPAHGKKPAGWSKVDTDTSETDEIKKVKGVSSVKKIKPTYNRDNAPTGINQKYKKFINTSSKGI